jgi:hypothetical protein
VLAEYREQRIDSAILLGSFHDISPTLALIEGAPEGDDLPLISAPSSFGRGPPRSASFGINRKGHSPNHHPSEGVRELSREQIAAAASGADCVLSLLEDDARFKERDHRRAGGGTRDEKLAQKIIEKLSRRKGFVTAALKRWDEEQQVFVPASSGGANGGGGATPRGTPRGGGGGGGGGALPLDRKAFAGCSFAIEHFGATVLSCADP